MEAHRRIGLSLVLICVGLWGARPAMGMRDDLPESVSVDVSSIFGQSVASAIASVGPDGPLLDLRVSAVGAAHHAGGDIIIYYYLNTVALVPDPPEDLELRLRTRIIGHISVHGNANAFIEVFLPDSSNAHGSYHMTWQANSRYIDPDPEFVPTVDVGLFPWITVLANTEQAIMKRGHIAVWGGEEAGQESGGQVVLDPIFEFDPDQLIDYHGVPTPVSALFRIDLSPNAIPEPGSVMMFVGLAGLVALRSRRPHSWAA